VQRSINNGGHDAIIFMNRLRGGPYGREKPLGSNFCKNILLWAKNFFKYHKAGFYHYERMKGGRERGEEKAMGPKMVTLNSIGLNREIGMGGLRKRGEGKRWLNVNQQE